MQILVEVKNVYGVQTVYPICEQAKFFAALAGTKTLTPQALKLIKQASYQVCVATPELAI
jgi:hypothetical protein